MSGIYLYKPGKGINSTVIPLSFCEYGIKTFRTINPGFAYIWLASN